jgi:Zn-dependent membrane protease YugP
MLMLDPTIFLLVPAVLLSLFAQWKVQSTFHKAAKIRARIGRTGADVAKELATRERVPVSVQPSNGFLSDHFNPATDTLALSPEVYSGRSLASLGVAAHELGHAMQKQSGYWPLAFRSGMVPLANLGSTMSMFLFFGGLLMSSKPLLLAGIALFSLAVLFTLITLPVEFDASRRALAVLGNHGMITPQERPEVKRVLDAAALTYVAAAVMAVVQLLRLVLIARSQDD